MTLATETAAKATPEVLALVCIALHTMGNPHETLPKGVCKYGDGTYGGYRLANLKMAGSTGVATVAPAGKGHFRGYSTEYLGALPGDVVRVQSHLGLRITSVVSFRTTALESA